MAILRYIENSCEFSWHVVFVWIYGLRHARVFHSRKTNLKPGPEHARR